MLVDYDMSQLVCEHSRIVTDRGVHVCPILIESPDALLADTLAEVGSPLRAQPRGVLYVLSVRGNLLQCVQLRSQR